MTYATAAAERSQKVRWLLKIAGVPGYLASWGDGSTDTWDDTSHGNATHGEQLLYGLLLGPPEISGGELDHARHLVTASTCSVRFANSSWWQNILSRRIEGQRITGAKADDDTSFVVSDASGLGIAADAYFWIGRECCLCSSVATNTINCTPAATHRGALGTKAEAHTQNTELALTPRRWKGVRVQLVLGVYDEAARAWQYQDPYKTFYLEASPMYDGGAWSLQMADVLTHRNRPIGVGFPLVDVTRIYIAANETKYRVYLADMRSILEAGATQNLGLWMEYQGRKGVFLVQDVETDYVTIYAATRSVMPDVDGSTVSFVEFITTDAEYGTDYYSDLGQARAVYACMRDHGDPNPAAIALKLMLSDKGDGANHATFDCLPGADPANEFEPQIRAGAGLTTDEVDVDSWEDAYGSLLPSSGFIVNGSGSEERLLDVLTADLAAVMGGYVYPTPAGKIAFRKYEPATAATAASASVTASNKHIGGDSAVDDEEPIIGSMLVKAAWSWSQQAFLVEHHIHFLEQKKLRGDDWDRQMVLESRLAGQTHEDIRALMDLYYGRWGEGAIRYSIPGQWPLHLVEPADTIAYTNSRIPDFEGGMGITAQLCEVVGVAPAMDSGRVMIDAIKRATCKLIAPSATLGSNITGNQWNVSEAYTIINSDEEWAAGWRVVFINPATGSKRTAGYSYATIAAVTSSSMTFTNPPTDIAAGDLIEMADYGDIDDEVTAANTTSGATQTDHAYISADAAAPSPGHKWG